MCRIAGIVHPLISVEKLQQTVAEMCTLLKHGGPDDEGIFIAGNIGLGFVRLSIIDL